MKAKTLLCAGALVLTSALPVAQAQIAGIQPLGGTSAGATKDALKDLPEFQYNKLEKATKPHKISAQ
ncbi:hypothetical protein [Paraburkholderia phenazinium]|uniref:Uncharacterized protein n=1 Tax=Paraburkholderia phenazinium TaxID=60549 RepID=A0A1G8JEG6_9BURK|nr:hypothetical protein [Paraburkholderia phenazinium]SDI29648.1 hypothetical protein SAMN05216466_12073 [Paraburkholderia phenazinium]